MSATASAASAVSGSAFMSVRGTITSRTIFSAKSETASRSASSASSRSASSSFSVARYSTPVTHGEGCGSSVVRCTAQRHGRAEQPRQRVEHRDCELRDRGRLQPDALRVGDRERARQRLPDGVHDEDQQRPSRGLMLSSVRLPIAMTGAGRHAEPHTEPEGERGDERGGRTQPVRALRERLERPGTLALRLDQPMDAARGKQHDGGLGRCEHGAEHGEGHDEHDDHQYHSGLRVTRRGQDESVIYRKNS